MGDDVNLLVPQAKSLVSQWYPVLLDAVSDKVQTGRRHAFAAVSTGTTFVQVQLAKLLTHGTRHLSTSNSRRPINAR